MDRLEGSGRRRSPVPWVALALVTLAGLLLRAFRLSHPALSNDELATFAFASAPLERLLGPDYARETNPPLFYLLQHAWLRLGTSPAAFRSLALLFGALVVPLTYAAGARLVGRRAALVGAALVATADVHVAFGREARAYSLFTAAFLGLLVSLVRLVESYGEPLAFGEEPVDAGAPAPRPRRALAWAGYIGCAVLTLYAHNTALLVPLLATGLVLGLVAARALPARFLWPWAAANALVLAIFAPWLTVVVDQARATVAHFWIPRSTWPWVRSQLMGLYPFAGACKPAFLALALAGAWSLRRRPRALASLLVFSAGFPLLLYLASLVRPIFYLRPMVPLTVPTFLLMGAAIDAVARRRGRRTVVAGTLLAASLQLLTLPRLYPRVPASTDAAGVVAPLREFRAPSDVLVVAPVQVAWQLRYEARVLPEMPGLGLSFGDAPPQLSGWYGVREVPRADLVRRIDDAARVWLLREVVHRFPPRPGDGFDPVEPELAAWGRLEGRWRSGNLELVRFAARSPVMVAE